MDSQSATKHAGLSVETVYPASASEFTPIDDYAAIGDCRSVALVSKRGSMDWLCFPHFSGPSLFAALLDPVRGGHFLISPNGTFQVQRGYVGETNVLESTFQTGSGRARLTDCMVIPDPAQERMHLQPEREVLRVIEGLEGEVELDVTYAPRPDFARAQWRFRKYGRLGWACPHQDELFLLHSNMPLESDAQGNTLHGRMRLRAGEKRYFSLTYAKQSIATIVPLGEDADRRLDSTLRWWRDWLSQCTYDGYYRDAVIRSALTLKLMTYSLSGAVVAAPTSSLPEKIGGVRNWDYRYCWLRDATLTLGVFDKLGFRTEELAFLNWLLYSTRLSWPRLQVMYDVYGQTRLSEQNLDHLRGYEYSRPVRLGNGAHSQTQLDLYGEVILAAYHAIQAGARLDRNAARMLKGFGQTICQRWGEKDHGIWESRNQGAQNTYSKVMCWVGLTHLLRLHEQNHLQVPVKQIKRVLDAIREAVETRGFDEKSNSYTTAFGTNEVDASLLLLSRWNYTEATHPRMRGTWARIERELKVKDCLLYRYRTGFDDYLPAGEGAFGIASFWAIDYLVQCGDVDEAAERFEKLLGYASDLGLYGEEIDPGSGGALGNYPQAFTHVGLINAALAIDSALTSRDKQGAKQSSDDNAMDKRSGQT